MAIMSSWPIKSVRRKRGDQLLRSSPSTRSWPAWALSFSLFLSFLFLFFSFFLYWGLNPRPSCWATSLVFFYFLLWCSISLNWKLPRLAQTCHLQALVSSSRITDMSHHTWLSVSFFLFCLIFTFARAHFLELHEYVTQQCRFDKMLLLSIDKHFINLNVQKSIQLILQKIGLIVKKLALQFMFSRKFLLVIKP